MRVLLIGRSAMLILAILTLASLGGCLLPAQGTPVFVDMRAGHFWSGKGMLVEVSRDEQSCRVEVRDSALIVRKLWVDCTRVHPRLES